MKRKTPLPIVVHTATETLARHGIDLPRVHPLLQTEKEQAEWRRIRGGVASMLDMAPSAASLGPGLLVELVSLRMEKLQRWEAQLGRAKGTARARTARAQKLDQEDARLAAEIRGLRRRGELSERAIARRLGVSRRKVAKILARSGS